MNKLARLAAARWRRAVTVAGSMVKETASPPGVRAAVRGRSVGRSRGVRPVSWVRQ